MKQQKQSGFAHLMIITVVLGLGLVGTLGYVFYQNFVAKKNSIAASSLDSTKDKRSDTTEKGVVYKKYTDNVFDVSFEYPGTWSLGQLEIPSSDDPYWNRGIEVKNEDGEVMAKLILGVNGIGGTCMGDNGKPVLIKHTVIDVVPSAFEGKDPVVMSFFITKNLQSGGYDASYGLNNTLTEVRDYELCMFYNLFESNIKNTYGSGYIISFGNGFMNNSKNFANIDDAKKYAQSDEYKAIKKMILSLSRN